MVCPPSSAAELVYFASQDDFVRSATELVYLVSQHDLVRRLSAQVLSGEGPFARHP